MSTRALPVILLAVGLLATSPLPAAGPVTLEEPSSGKAVAVEPGARALHLVFFATWCPTCVDELERLAEIEARWSGRGYRLVIVAVRTRQSSERLADFVAAARPPGRLLFDAAGEAEKRWAAKHLPTHVLLDAAGREIARSSTLDDTIEAAIAGLLAEPRGGARGR